MKIAIVGNYGNNNNGDEAILLGILTQLTENFNVSVNDIIVFSNNPKQTEERYGVKSYPLYYKTHSVLRTSIQTVRKAYEYLKDVDVVIIGGGGILMDLYKREAPLFGSYGIVGRRRGAHVIVYGCGAGPVNSYIGRTFLRRLAKASHSISVRDPKSKVLLQSIGINKTIETIGDPAFNLASPYKHTPTKAIQKIGVTAVPYYSKEYWPQTDEKVYKSYIHMMARNLDQCIRENQVEVTFFSTKYPQDVQVSVDIVKEMKEKESVQIIEENLSPADIMRVSSQQDVVIGTRLHSLILALNAETPVIGVSYHEKVESFMEMIGLGNNCFSIDALEQSSTLFSNTLFELNEDWQAVQANTVTIASKLKEKAAKGLKQFSMLPPKGKKNE
ncbi:MAG TPA: polysaccharide pyruvyl transferase family protein [Bacillus sp. (in: firmicutes)]|nr:polysaccharide pyruvyl transferase family protein [Bacillus sp. (in: firmicutes)]